MYKQLNSDVSQVDPGVLVMAPQLASADECSILAEWPELAEQGDDLRVSTGTCLFRQAEAPAAGFLIVSGMVKLVREERGEDQIVGLRTPGWFLGGQALLLTQAHCITARTITRARLRRILAPEFQRLMDGNRRFARRLHRLHCRELSRQLQAVAVMGRLTARERLEEFLVSVLPLDTRPGSCRIRLSLPLRKWELAQLLAISPEHLSRTLREMELGGVIQRHKGWIEVVDTAQLPIDVPRCG